VLNFILPSAFSNTAFIPYAPAFILPVLGFTSYAIVKHRFLDIRRAAARGLAYALTVGFLGIAYSLIVFGASSLFLGSTGINRKVQMLDTLLAVVLAFSFQSIKRFFDKLSSRVFYKDTYNPQVFLDELNQLLVGQVELDQLVHRSISAIETSLKSGGCVFAIRPTAYAPERMIASAGSRVSDSDITELRPMFAHLRQRVIVADYLDSEHLELGRQLNSRDMAVVVRLTPHLTATADHDVGEIILGPKRNGDPYTTDDVQVLEIIANELVIAFQNALRFEEIQNFNLTLQAKVDEATRKLRRANEKLKSLDETKDDFISMASHQLRTPLTSVKGYLSMILEGDAGKVTGTQKEMLGQAFFSSQRMVYLIADLLNVSRLKTGTFVIERAPVNLATVVEQVLSQLEETAKSRQLTLSYDKPKEFPSLMLDETKTRQVIMNFVDNAIYYTPAGGHITVQLVDNPSTVELRVVDNGIGVPKHEQPHLFTKFYRAGNARKARPDGTGLGLFMAKKVVAAQGGSIIFDSQDGKGSTFGFIFSKSKLAAPAPVTPAPVAKKPAVKKPAATKQRAKV
jgi:signal transduction histidine kinase